jgi:hypothetical protein
MEYAQLMSPAANSPEIVAKKPQSRSPNPLVLASAVKLIDGF